ncbi:MAG: saccharopine dehydrogenase NADP-binding domain-containing protein, partial [Nocardia sp.]|nr:saccharopine dehydrogenase NADP-binding domain-containing protein [Nocardia sp.]
MPKIVLFGATGYTGRLIAETLVEQGAAPLLAARDAGALRVLSAELGGVETAVADSGDPDSVRALLGKGDVLISTVGPFLRFGDAALAAAIDAGAHYLDSTGEGPFIRKVFDHDEPARAAGVGLLTAFGYDYVPGNLAAGLALEQAPEAVRADIGYFMSHAGTSGGTQASVVGMMFERAFALRGGKLTEQNMATVRGFDVEGRRHTAVSIPGSEHLALPRAHPKLRDIDVYLGVPGAGALAQPMRFATALTGAIARVDPLKRLAVGGLNKIVKGSTGGPSPQALSRTRSWVVADASDDSGRVLASQTLTGGDPYSFTAAILAWGARTALAGGLRATGA